MFKHPRTVRYPGKNGGLFDCCVSKCAFAKSASVNQSKLVPKYVFKVCNNTITVNKIKKNSRYFIVFLIKVLKQKSKEDYIGFIVVIVICLIGL